MKKNSTDRDFKFKRDLPKTQSTFTDDPILNRAKQVRRDNDNVKNPTVNLEEIDAAIISFINEVIKPSIVENGNIIQVKAIFASPEKWASIQLHGFIRDDKQKLLSPIIAIKRESMSPRADLPKNKVLVGDGNEITVKRKFTDANRYDKFRSESEK